MSFARIEGREIVIRIPFEALPIALEYVCDTNFDPADEQYRIVDIDEVAREFVSAFNREENDERFSTMLDETLLNVIENGAFGMEEFLNPEHQDDI